MKRESKTGQSLMNEDVKTLKILADQNQWYIKKKKIMIQLDLFEEYKVLFTNQCVIHKRGENQMVSSTDAKNCVWQNTTFIHRKSLISKLETEGNLFILINNIYKNFTGKIANVFPMRWGIRQDCLL